MDTMRAGQLSNNFATKRSFVQWRDARILGIAIHSKQVCSTFHSQAFTYLIPTGWKPLGSLGSQIVTYEPFPLGVTSCCFRFIFAVPDADLHFWRPHNSLRWRGAQAYFPVAIERAGMNSTGFPKVLNSILRYSWFCCVFPTVFTDL